MGSHSLLQGIFLTQGMKLGLLHCRKTLYYLGHQGIPIVSKELAKLFVSSCDRMAFPDRIRRLRRLGGVKRQGFRRINELIINIGGEKDIIDNSQFLDHNRC